MSSVGNTPTRLPQEAVRLVHYVELHRSGWWDRALDRLVLVSLWLVGPCGPTEIAENLLTLLDGQLTQDRVLASLNTERDAGRVVEVGDGKVKVAEDVAKSLRDELDVVSRSEEVVKDQFISIACDHGVDADPVQLWTDFESMFLYPLLAQLGARVYELFSGDFRLDKSVPFYGQLIQPICKKYGDELRVVLIAFLNPHDSAIRSYILRRLNLSFIRQAAGLNIDVLKKLGEARGHERLQIFLDTNFVFSFLKLHDNPANEVADDLLALIDTIVSSVAVELYVLPITVDEIRRVIRDVCGKLENVVPQPNLAEATRRITPSGPVSRYLEAAASANHRLSPSDFFDPYDSGLITILKERGIKLYNTNLDDLRMDQAVLDDLLAQAKVQERVRPSGAKPYASNLHDMVLWHFVARNRAAGAQAPLESGMWVCTVDYGLIAFDRHKRKRIHTPPVCLAPSSLIQLLQFWAPRTEQWDKAFVGSVREPLLFLDFDLPSEATTISILKTISRFEDVGDLSPSTIYNVLTDKALRVRLEQTPRPGAEATVELIQSAIVGEAHRLEEELGRLSEEHAADSEASRARVDDAIKQAEGLKAMLKERHQGSPA